MDQSARSTLDGAGSSLSEQQPPRSAPAAQVAAAKSHQHSRSVPSSIEVAGSLTSIKHSSVPSSTVAATSRRNRVQQHAYLSVRLGHCQLGNRCARNCGRACAFLDCGSRRRGEATVAISAPIFEGVCIDAGGPVLNIHVRTTGNRPCMPRSVFGLVWICM